MTETATAPTTERRAFRMHRDMLWSIIQSQAGTLSKAILELVMNSVDAGASKVTISLDTQNVKVVDDGKGFTSREEIEQFFETFGTPHAAGDATFGKFRMGRGQIMAFTANRWLSGDFTMFVNIRDLGLEYDLSKLDKPAKGCTIEGHLFKALEASSLIRLIDELRALCKYAPIPVIVNGERISQDLRKLKWTDEDDDAYYLIRDGARSMAVYNLGVHVRDYWRGEFGVCGLIVSKRQLEVNFARNDVLADQCEVFKRMKKKLKAFAKKEEADKPRSNEAYREMMLDKLLTGAFDTADEFYEALCEAKVVTDYSGKHYSFEGLARALYGYNECLVAAEDHSIRADKVHQNKLALVVDPKTMARASNLSLVEVMQRVISNLSSFPGMSGQQLDRTIDGILTPLIEAVRDLDDVGSMIDESKKIIDPSQYTQEERLVLKVLTELSRFFVLACDLPYGSVRRLGLCESETLDGFTDGSRLIYVNRKFLKIGGGSGHVFRAFETLKALLVHEYLHDVDDSRGHEHGAEFYERFHDIMSNDKLMQEFTYDAARMYLAKRRKAGVKMRSADLTSLDTVLIEDIGHLPCATEKDYHDLSRDTYVADPYVHGPAKAEALAA